MICTTNKRVPPIASGTPTTGIDIKAGVVRDLALFFEGLKVEQIGRVLISFDSDQRCLLLSVQWFSEFEHSNNFRPRGNLGW